jgi:hypothetical protein
MTGEQLLSELREKTRELESLLDSYGERLRLPLQVTSAARRDHPSHDPAALHDHQRRHLFDPEVLGEVGSLLHVDPHERKGVVVLPPLQSLREEPLCATTATGRRRVEEDEFRSARAAVLRGLPLPGGGAPSPHTPRPAAVSGRG